jgi:hypothetical protein
VSWLINHSTKPLKQEIDWEKIPNVKARSNFFMKIELVMELVLILYYYLHWN